MTNPELPELSRALTNIPFLDYQIGGQSQKQQLLRETWPDLDRLFCTELLSPAMRNPCLEFIVRSELLRIEREAWRSNFSDHTPHSFHSLAEIDLWLFTTPASVPGWLGTVLSKMETLPQFIEDYLACNPLLRDDDPNAFEPAIQLYTKRLLCDIRWLPKETDSCESDEQNGAIGKKKGSRRCSPREEELFQTLGRDEITALTNMELWKRHQHHLRKNGWKRTSFRASIKRIRGYYRLPSSAQVTKKAAQQFSTKRTKTTQPTEAIR